LLPSSYRKDNYWNFLGGGRLCKTKSILRSARGGMGISRGVRQVGGSVSEKNPFCGRGTWSISGTTD